MIEEDNKSFIEKISNMGENNVEKSKYLDLKKKYREVEKEAMKNKNSFILEKSEAETIRAKFKQLKDNMEKREKQQTLEYN